MAGVGLTAGHGNCTCTPGQASGKGGKFKATKTKYMYNMYNITYSEASIFRFFDNEWRPQVWTGLGR